MNYSQENTAKIKRQVKSKKKKAKNKAAVLTFRIVMIVILVGGFAAVGGLMGAYFGILEEAPKLEPIKVVPDIYTTMIYDSKGNEIDRLKGEENREYVSFDKIPQNLKDAFVAIEDERFYQHDGVDYRGMMRAVYSTVFEGDTQGASTITQQLIKNSVLKISRNTPITKLQEQYLAIQYEKMLLEEYHTKQAVKDYILEVYLNAIALSHNINGVQSAAYFYFNKDVSELTLSECAVIAAITQNPTKYTPLNKPENNRVRRDVVLDYMAKQGYITEEEKIAAKEDDVYSRIVESEQVTAFQESYHSYFVDQIILDVSRDLQEKMNLNSAAAINYIYNGGLQIYTTQDMEMQRIMDESFMNDAFFPARDFKIEIQYDLSVQNTITEKITNYWRRGDVKTEAEIDGWIDMIKSELVGQDDVIIAERIIPVPQPQAAMVIMDHHNGHVKAMTGGRGDKVANLTLNRAVASTRQPGSIFKILAVYAPAIDLGYVTPSTIIVDEPYTYNGYTPTNWYGAGYRGASTVRDGIRNSMNILAVKTMVSTGIDACIDYLLNFGFTTLLTESTYINGSYYTDRGAATALGGITNGVTQLELCAAFSAIANDGIYTKPILYTKVLDHNGRPILENEPETHQVIKKSSAYVLTDMMKSVITAGTGGKAAFKNSQMPLAGKTGTTSDTKDLMFTGYTPYYTASIWLGFDQSGPMTQDEGFHLRLWSDVMEKIHTGLPIKQFEQSDGVTTVTICRDSGLLAREGLCSNDIRGSRLSTDIFMIGTQPLDYCDRHVEIVIDSVSYKRFGPNCPSEYMERIIGVINKSPDAKLTPDSAWSIPESFPSSPVCNDHDINHGGEVYMDPFVTPSNPIIQDSQPEQESFEGFTNPIIDDSGFITAPADEGTRAAVTPMPAAATPVPGHISQPVMP